MSELTDTIAKIKDLAAVPLQEDSVIKRVEIIVLKFKEPPEVIDKCISRIIHNTNHPFKLTIFDNRPNTANTSKIWNKLIKESTCDYVLIMDSDAFIPEKKTTPCWLTRMMESIHETGFVIPVSNRNEGENQQVAQAEEYPAVRRNHDIWSGYCFLMKKSAYELVGPFNEKFYIYGQDSEFAYRVGKMGGAAMRFDVLVEHIGGFSFKQDPIRDEDKMYARKLFNYLTK